MFLRGLRIHHVWAIYFIHLHLKSLIDLTISHFQCVLCVCLLLIQILKKVGYYTTIVWTKFQTSLTWIFKKSINIMVIGPAIFHRC